MLYVNMYYVTIHNSKILCDIAVTAPSKLSGEAKEQRYSQEVPLEGAAVERGAGIPIQRRNQLSQEAGLADVGFI